MRENGSQASNNAFNRGPMNFVWVMKELEHFVHNKLDVKTSEANVL